MSSSNLRPEDQAIVDRIERIVYLLRTDRDTETIRLIRDLEATLHAAAERECVNCPYINLAGLERERNRWRDLARSANDVGELEHQLLWEAEEYQCATQVLNDLRVPTHDLNGKLSLVGRIHAQCDGLRIELEKAKETIKYWKERDALLSHPILDGPSIGQVQKQLADARAELAALRETFTDEEGNIWSPPTAWAYYAVCKARDKHAGELAARPSWDPAELKRLIENIKTCWYGFAVGTHSGIDAVTASAALYKTLEIEP